MTFECDPEKANELKPLLYKEVDNIIREGVTEEELSKVVKNTLKEAEQSKQHNAYWLTTLVTYYSCCMVRVRLSRLPLRRRFRLVLRGWSWYSGW